ncbi:MAG: pilus assembly protein PilM [Lachnospiraceae bacterium]|nr:pilus assembly protein PilM [Lachnospiraceae bacterium]
MAKSNKVLTIDITNESITIIEVTPSMKKQTNVHNALIFETPEDSYEDGTIRNVEKIAGAIREQLEKNGISNKNAIFVLTSTKIVNREVLIPEVKENKIKGIVSANATEYFPVNIEDYVISHSVLEHVVNEDKSKQIKLMVVAAPISMVKGYYELGSMLGLNVQSIDYVGNSMLQLIKTQTSATMTTMVIQLGSESTILNIVKGDTLLLQRTVPYGTNAVVTEVMDEHGVDATTAMTMLQNDRLITVDFDDNAATGAFRYLINNIGRVIDYYVTKNPDKPIDDVYLTGDGALIRGIDGLFKIQLNIQTKVMDSLYNVKFDPKIDMKVYSPVYLISAIGASFAPMGFKLSDARSSKSSTSSADAVKYSAVAFVVLCALGVGSVVATTILKNNAQAKKDNLNAQILAIQDVEQVINEWKEKKAKYEDAKLMYDQTRTLNENVSMFIDALEENQPKDIVITDFKSDKNGVTVIGSSESYDAIAKLITQLKKVECIDEIYVSQIDENKTEGSSVVSYEFQLQCVYVSMVPEEPEDELEGTSDELQVQ